MLENETDFGSFVVPHAVCDDDLLLRLIKRCVEFADSAIYSAVSVGSFEGAKALIESDCLLVPVSREEVALKALEIAGKHEADAVAIESGKVGSYQSPADYRLQASRLREFVEKLRQSDMS